MRRASVRSNPYWTSACRPTAIVWPLSIKEGSRSAASICRRYASEGAAPRQILSSNGGAGGNLSWCGWVTNARLACQTFTRDSVAGDVLAATNIIAVDAAGGNLKVLSNRRSDRALYADYRGGSVIDWSATDNGSLLMTRSYVPEGDTGTRIASRAEGLGVDRVDSVSAAGRRVEVGQSRCDLLSVGWPRQCPRHGDARLYQQRTAVRFLDPLSSTARKLAAVGSRWRRSMSLPMKDSSHRRSMPRRTASTAFRRLTDARPSSRWRSMELARPARSLRIPRSMSTISSASDGTAGLLACPTRPTNARR
jgi:hypothetical protein